MRNESSAAARLAIAALSGLLCFAPAVARATFPGLNGQISYSQGGSAAGVYLTDGGQIVAGQILDPSFSPTGTKLVYIDGNSNLVYVSQADGGNPIPIIGAGNFSDGSGSNPHISSPAWDPAGQSIWFVITNTLTHNGIWKIAASGAGFATQELTD